jgi:RHS repeat-associated protein
LSLAVVASDAGAVVQQYQYDSYGQSTNTLTEVGPGAASYAYRYTGQRLDGGTGLYDYKARVYSQILGRFLQPDPAGLDQGPNLYEYVGNAPLSAGDPSGECLGVTCSGAGGGGGDPTGTSDLADASRLPTTPDNSTTPRAPRPQKNGSRGLPTAGSTENAFSATVEAGKAMHMASSTLQRVSGETSALVWGMDYQSLRASGKPVDEAIVTATARSGFGTLGAITGAPVGVALGAAVPIGGETMIPEFAGGVVAAATGTKLGENVGTNTGQLYALGKANVARAIRNTIVEMHAQFTDVMNNIEGIR